MSMDEVREAMVAFADRLNELNQSLKSSFAGLQEAHEQVDPLWRDAMRRQYDSVWNELETEMTTYVDHIGPELLEKLVVHLRHSREYLDG